MYQQRLSDVATFLDEAEITLYEAMLNLMMDGELKDWNSLSPVNDVINVDDFLLEASEDANVQVLLKLCRQIRFASQNLQKSQ